MFLELHSTLSEKKDFRHRFSFFNRFLTRCSIDTCKGLEYLFYLLGKRFIKLKHIKIYERVQKTNNKIVSKEAAECDY